MRTKIYNGLKILSLVLVLSIGVSYVSAAWVTPSTPPPGGNVPAPINTSAKAQIKSGDLTVQNFTANGSASVAGNITTNDVYLSSVGKYASALGGNLVTVSNSNTYGAPGSPSIWATVSCPAGTTLMGCSGFYPQACSGSWLCGYEGAQPWGNGCAAAASVNANVPVYVYAYCH